MGVSFSQGLDSLKIEHNCMRKRLILLAWKLATPWLWSLMLSCSHRTTNLYSAWTIVSFPCNILNIHLLVLHSSLSSCSKHNLCPGNIVNIRGNDNRGTSILFYSRDDTRPLDAWRSTVHLPAHSVDNGCGFHAALPRFLTNKRRSSVFTPWIKCSFVEEFWRPNLFFQTGYLCLPVRAHCSMA